MESDVDSEAESEEVDSEWVEKELDRLLALPEEEIAEDCFLTDVDGCEEAPAFQHVPLDLSLLESCLQEQSVIFNEAEQGVDEMKRLCGQVEVELTAVLDAPPKLDEMAREYAEEMEMDSALDDFRKVFQAEVKREALVPKEERVKLRQAWVEEIVEEEPKIDTVATEIHEARLEELEVEHKQLEEEHRSWLLNFEQEQEEREREIEKEIAERKETESQYREIAALGLEDLLSIDVRRWERAALRYDQRGMSEEDEAGYRMREHEKLLKMEANQALEAERLRRERKLEFEERQRMAVADKQSSRIRDVLRQKRELAAMKLQGQRSQCVRDAERLERERRKMGVMDALAEAMREASKAELESRRMMKEDELGGLLASGWREAYGIKKKKICLPVALSGNDTTTSTSSSSSSSSSTSSKPPVLHLPKRFIPHLVAPLPFVEEDCAGPPLVFKPSCKLMKDAESAGITPITTIEAKKEEGEEGRHSSYPSSCPPIIPFPRPRCGRKMCEVLETMREEYRGMRRNIPPSHPSSVVKARIKDAPPTVPFTSNSSSRSSGAQVKFHEEALNIPMDIIKLECRMENLSEVPSIASMLNLQVLNLSSNRITNLSSLRQSTCTDLRQLHVQQNQLTSLDGVQGLPNLEVINATMNAITDARAVQNLSRLHAVDLGNNKLTSLPLLHTPYLQKLRLYRNRVNVPPTAFLRECGSLVHLDLGRNRLTSLQEEYTHTNVIDGGNKNDAFLKDNNNSHDNNNNDDNNNSHLFSSSLPMLQQLVLYENQLEELPVLHLPLLTELWLSGNRLTKLSLRGFLPSLEQLHVQGNRLEEVGAPLVGSPNLKCLDLSFNSLSPPSFPDLSFYPALEQLQLNDNPISEVGDYKKRVLRSLAHPKSLRELDNDASFKPLVEEISCELQLRDPRLPVLIEQGGTNNNDWGPRNEHAVGHTIQGVCGLNAHALEWPSMHELNQWPKTQGCALCGVGTFAAMCTVERQAALVQLTKEARRMDQITDSLEAHSSDQLWALSRRGELWARFHASVLVQLSKLVTEFQRGSQSIIYEWAAPDPRVSVARQLQAWWRGLRTRAVVKIQRWNRYWGINARTLIRVQAMWRGRCQRKKLGRWGLHTRKITTLATKLQARWRGSTVRKRFMWAQTVAKLVDDYSLPQVEELEEPCFVNPFDIDIPECAQVPVSAWETADDNGINPKKEEEEKEERGEGGEQDSQQNEDTTEAQVPRDGVCGDENATWFSPPAPLPDYCPSSPAMSAVPCTPAHSHPSRFNLHSASSSRRPPRISNGESISSRGAGCNNNNNHLHDIPTPCSPTNGHASSSTCFSPQRRPKLERIAQEWGVNTQTAKALLLSIKKRKKVPKMAGGRSEVVIPSQYARPVLSAQDAIKSFYKDAESKQSEFHSANPNRKLLRSARQETE